ncbi:hypothetical protein [Anaerosporobacter sp.]|uniref:hypothetical protein n=1 Tax=Anaerosporobacter sp. TaxID=1872529 RepID=UPI00286EBF70|nr:hypothetical protein [Anaerosporobacter sp.]
MKIKIKVLLAVAIVAAVVIVAFCTRQKVLGNMSHTIKEVKTSSSEFSFTGSEGDRIKISLRTTVKSGTVDFILSDSKGNVVAALDRAKELETYLDLSYDDTYTLTAEYTEFTGKFSVKVSKKR